MSRVNFMFLGSWLLLPPIVLIALHGNFLISILLYLMLPSIYFSVKKPEIIPRASSMSIVATLIGFVLDWMAFFNHAWTVSTLFSFRILHLVPVEDFLFIFFAAYVVIAGTHFYYPQLSPRKLDAKRFKKTGTAVFLCFLLFLVIQATKRDLLLIPYYDAWLLSIAFIIPSALFLASHPSSYTPLLFIVGFQLVAMLPYELIADALGFWTFPATDYVGMIHLLGQTFPTEEFLEWMIFMVPAVLGFNLLLGGNSTRHPR